jgi:hypothetical protein
MLPATLLEQDIERRITAINTITAYCGVEKDGSYIRHTGLSEVTSTMNTNPQPLCNQSLEMILGAQLYPSRQIAGHPYASCGNADLPMCDRVKNYATVGSLSRHFRRHVTKLKMGKQIDYKVCNVRGMHRMHL